MHVAHDEGNGLFQPRLSAIGELTAKSINTEFSPAGGKFCRGKLLYGIRTHISIIAIR